MPVVDASIVVDWVSPDSDPAGPAGRLLDALSESGATVVVPRLLRQEVADVLLTGCRRGRWDGVAADLAFRGLSTLPLAVMDDPRTLELAWELSRRYDNHPVYDMVYVALAEQIGEELFTADEALRRRLVGLDFVTGL